MAKILIVEDEAPILMLLKRILGGSGHEIMVATDGGAACAIASEHCPDLILSDLSMPGSPTGLELIRTMRKKAPGCPLVVVSGYSTEETISECRQIGVDDFLPKPFELSFVRSFVDGVLKRYAHVYAQP